MTPLTVLYIHGLESGPKGRKARYLAQAGYTVVSEQMPCGRAQLVRDPAVLGTFAAALAALALGAAFFGFGGLAVAALAVAALSPVARALLLRRTFRRSVEVQLRSLASQRIDVVVGSSFGGAVGLELLRRGAWAGPTLLLCPAHVLIAQRAGLPTPTLAGLSEAVAAQVLVVHGQADETVPVASSQALVDGTRMALLLVDDDHRLSATATPERFVEWIARLSPTAGE